MENKQKRTLKEDYNLIKRAVKLIESNTPHFLFYAIAFSFFMTIISFGASYITSAIVDELTGNRNREKLFILLCLYAVEIIIFVFRDFCWRKIRTFHFISTKWEEVLLNKKSFSMDYCNMEDPLVRAKRQMITDSHNAGGLGKLMQCIVSLSEASFLLLICGVMSLRLFFMHSDKPLQGTEKFVDSYLLTLIFLAFVIVCIICEYRITRKYNRLNVENTKELSMTDRLLHYYLDDYLDDSKACKDIHIYNQKKIITHSSDEIYKSWITGFKKLHVVNRMRLNRYNLFYILVTGSTCLYIALKTSVGTLGLGAFMLYLYCVRNAINSAENFSTQIAELRSNNDYLELFFDYLDTPTEMHYGTIPTEKRMDNKYDIEFHNVSFKYPNTDKYVIKNLSFKFRVGDRIAVVGMNGSGKTTMIKLLCRLYDPTEGYITLNGIDIQKYDYEDYLDLFSVVFQDFRLFSFSVGENVAAEVEYDEDKVWDSLNKAGMLERVKAMPEGLKTPVYKDFEENGVEISGGEAQKLAIARALYKDAAFVILDEPTASLDPIAEHEIYSRFNDMVQDKTAIYISHRLSSCRFCKRILVFHEGELIQNGSHDTLLENTDGKYYELWNAQAQYYAEKQ